MSNRSIIEAANTAWNKALNSGDVKSLVALYAENATLSPGDGHVLVGHAEIEKLFNGFVDAGVHNHTLEIVEVSGADDIIYQVARWSAKGAESNGEKPLFGGITTSVLQRGADGQWLAHAHVWNVNQ